LAEGISVNVTLIFSCSATPPLWTPISRARATAAGRDLSRLASVASFFVSRVDTEVDARLDELATTAASALRGGAAVANAVLAFAHHDEILASDRWARLDAAGARHSDRCGPPPASKTLPTTTPATSSTSSPLES
jgi:transaldolase